jgi:hypothetical protein
MSCLFISLDYFVKETSYIVRQKICDYLEENKPIMEGLDTKFILDMENPNYIQNMRNTSTWGGAIEIQSACNIWNLRIIVKDIRHRHSQNNNIEFIPINNKFDRSITLEWSGGHYEPVRN